MLATAGPAIVAVGELAGFREGRPDLLAVAVGRECGLVGDLDAWRFERGDHELAVPFILHAAEMIAVEDYAFHGACGAGHFFRVFQGARKWLGAESVVIAIVNLSFQIAIERPEPTQHVFPR